MIEIMIISILNMYSSPNVYHIGFVANTLVFIFSKSKAAAVNTIVLFAIC